MSAAQGADLEQEECALLFLPLPKDSLWERLLAILQQGNETLTAEDASEHLKDVFRRVAKVPLPDIADLFSARHGYAHVAVDCCGVRDARQDGIELGCDVGPGVRFAIHVTRDCHGIGLKEIARWDNETPPRPYGRLPLSQLAKLGVRCETFCQKVNAFLARGANYSEWRYWSMGLLSPSDAVCTDLVTQCLEPALQQWIYDSLNRQHPHALPPMASKDLAGEDVYFVSPNGYAIALGLPHGSQITTPNQRLTADLRLFGM